MEHVYLAYGFKFFTGALIGGDYFKEAGASLIFRKLRNII